jgi:hypothetical protein
MNKVAELLRTPENRAASRAGFVAIRVDDKVSLIPSGTCFTVYAGWVGSRNELRIVSVNVNARSVETYIVAF